MARKERMEPGYDNAEERERERVSLENKAEPGQYSYSKGKLTKVDSGDNKSGMLSKAGSVLGTALEVYAVGPGEHVKMRKQQQENAANREYQTKKESDERTHARIDRREQVGEMSEQDFTREITKSKADTAKELATPEDWRNRKMNEIQDKKEQGRKLDKDEKNFEDDMIKRQTYIKPEKKQISVNLD